MPDTLQDLLRVPVTVADLPVRVALTLLKTYGPSLPAARVNWWYQPDTRNYNVHNLENGGYVVQPCVVSGSDVELTNDFMAAFMYTAMRYGASLRLAQKCLKKHKPHTRLHYMMLGHYVWLCTDPADHRQHPLVKVITQRLELDVTSEMVWSSLLHSFGKGSEFCRSPYFKTYKELAQIDTVTSHQLHTHFEHDYKTGYDLIDTLLLNIV
jgi:hypothetical protein